MNSKFTYIIDKAENYRHLSQFRDQTDFNNNIEMFLASHKAEYTKGELVAFKQLIRLAIKVPGIATASIRYILQAINDSSGGYGISESTFHRMRRKTVKLGALSVETTGRGNGSQSSNVWIFQRADLDTNETPSDNEEVVEGAPVRESIVKQSAPRKSYHSIKANKSIKDTYRHAPTVGYMDYTFVYEPTFKRLIEAVKPFFADHATITELIKAIRQNSRKYKQVTGYDFASHADRKAIEDDIEAMAIDAFKRTISVEKAKRSSRKPVRNVIGLFVKIFREVTRDTFMFTEVTRV